MLSLITVGTAVGTVAATGTVQLLSAVVLGFSLAVIAIGWFIGGNAHSLPWLWGAVGEQQTAAVLDKLGVGWICVHAVPRVRGDWDHVLVGPAGCFMVESKNFSGTSRVENDALRCGRLRIDGSAMRAAAIDLKERIAELGIRAPFVHAVVVIWGDFPQRVFEENRVTYVHGGALREWVTARPGELDSQRLAELQTAAGVLEAGRSS